MKKSIVLIIIIISFSITACNQSSDTMSSVENELTSLRNKVDDQEILIERLEKNLDETKALIIEHQNISPDSENEKINLISEDIDRIQSAFNLFDENSISIGDQVADLSLKEIGRAKKGKQFFFQGSKQVTGVYHINNDHINGNSVYFTVLNSLGLLPQINGYNPSYSFELINYEEAIKFFVDDLKDSALVTIVIDDYMIGYYDPAEMNWTSNGEFSTAKIIEVID